MIDFHCHLLPSLDDGPDSVEESLAMARALAAFGFREVHCTPHCIAGHYEISPVEVRDAVRGLQVHLDREGIALTLRTGMEYYLDECFERFAANLLPLGDSKLVLCEAPPQAPPALVSEMASLIVVQGYIPLIAHPERSEPIWQLLEEQEAGTRAAGGQQQAHDPGAAIQERGAGSQKAAAMSHAPPAVSWWHRLFARVPRPVSENPEPSTAQLVSLELPEAALFQVNLGSFTGFYGAQPQRRAYELLQRGVYSCFASDLHDARSAVALLELAREKVEFNPAMKKLGEFIPPEGQGGNDQLAFW